MEVKKAISRVTRSRDNSLGNGIQNLRTNMISIGGLAANVTQMDSEKGRVFVGGISYKTTEEQLKDYFMTFGEVVEAVIIKNRFTGRSRGFAFLDFSDPVVAEALLLNSKHNIDGRMVSCFS